MESEGFKRKLSAILSADVVGYSRLMRDDEEATVRTLNDHKKMIFNLIERNQGRLVDSIGDNLLAEFSSVVDAVRCAVQIQEDLKSKNEGLLENRKMTFRIGINLGDVIQEGDRIYGDGVNVAARVESLAEVGGICISRSAYDQVKRKLNFRYEYLGEQKVKNIDEPVRVYKILMEPESEDAFQEEKLREPTSEIRRVDSISEKPSIAVLPFLNISSDPEQEYFVDGLSEEILNSLCQIPELTVIARTSSFSFKGTNKTVQEIASVLGVDNILEGSVRKAGNALRITSQLVKAVDGSHLWSKTYDRELKDIFEVQEEIATSVADELKLTLGIDQSLKQLSGTNNEKAYEYYLVAKAQPLDPTGRSRALKLIDAAIAMDPEFARAWAFKAFLHLLETGFGPRGLADSHREDALHAARKAVDLDPDMAAGYASLGLAKICEGEWIGAESAFHKALELSDETLSSFEMVAIANNYYMGVGYFKKAVDLLAKWRRIDPLNEELRNFYIQALCILGDHQRAKEELESGRVSFGNQWGGSTYLLATIRSGIKPPVVDLDKINVTMDRIIAIGINNFESPEKGLMELRRLYQDEKDLSSVGFIIISAFAAYLGDCDFAMDAMEKGYEKDLAGLYHVWLPVMHETRQLPRFKEFVREIGLVDYWNKFGWPDFCYQLDNGDFEFD